VVERRLVQVLELMESALAEIGTANKDRHTTSDIEVGREKRINGSRRRR